MGIFKYKIALPLLVFAVSGCDIMEVRGFFTSYEYANNRFEQSYEWNNVNGHTEINISQETYAINVMGDSHVGGTENLDTFLKNSQDEHVPAMVMVGDLTTGNEKDYDVFSEHLSAIDTMKYFAMVGNHDLFFSGWKHFYSLFGSSSYFFAINTPSQSDLFICLDTGGGTLGDLQLDWFKQLLETSRNNYRYCTVFTHNNILRFRVIGSTNPMVEEIQVLMDLFLRYDVNMVVTAHDHKRNTDHLGNTTHIIMDSLEDANDKASYVKLTINDDTIDFRFVEL